MMANNMTSPANCNANITNNNNNTIIKGGPSKCDLKQNIIGAYWSPEEQSLLEQLLPQYASDSIVKRYAKLAAKLPGKTLTDVAVRVRWMKVKAENQKLVPYCHTTNHAQLSTSTGIGECIDDKIAHKAMNQVSANASAYKEIRKGINNKSNSSRRHKVKKEKAAHHSNGLNHAQLSASEAIYIDEDTDDEISYKAIGGAAALLLERNDQAIDQIIANVSASKLHENVSLETQTRKNINALLHEAINNTPEMKKPARQLYDFPVLSRVKRNMDPSLVK